MADMTVFSLIFKANVGLEKAGPKKNWCHICATRWKEVFFIKKLDFISENNGPTSEFHKSEKKQSLNKSIPPMFWPLGERTCWRQTLLPHSMATQSYWRLHQQSSMLSSVGLVCLVRTTSACGSGGASDPILTQALNGASFYRQSSARHTLSTQSQTGKTKCWSKLSDNTQRF